MSKHEFAAYPLTAARWADFELLFGRSGACFGCWCTYFRLQPADRERLDASARRAFIRQRIDAGPPPGVLGYVDNHPVAWVQVGPRADVPRWNSSRTVSRPLEEADAVDPVMWAVSCFFIAGRQRGRGLSHHILAAAVAFAADSGARSIEACPVVEAKTSRSPGLYVGSARVFEAAGFRTVAERKPGRPLMRLSL